MNCTICKGLGFINDTIAKDNRIYDIAIECDCIKSYKENAIKERLLRNLNLPESEYTKTFETFEVNLMTQNVHNQVKSFSDDPNSRNMLLFSPKYGCGKSHLAKAVLLNNYNKAMCAYINTAKFFNDLKAGNFENLKSQKEALQKADLVILDDLTLSKPADWKIETYYEIFEDRYNNNLSTIITANIKTPCDLMAYLGGAAFDRFIKRAICVDFSNVPGRRRNVN